jgi:ABC-type uncharacterized transport system substrate-binding protein
MNKKVVTILVATLILSFAFSVRAQQPGRVPRIGFLIASSPSAMAPRLDAFQQGLRELGYVEGKNLVIERRHADGKSDHLPALAAELVSLNVDVIVTSGPTATGPAKEATSTIPIVMTFDDDPVASGFVASLARPGGNITGLATLAPEISASAASSISFKACAVPRLFEVPMTATRPSLGEVSFRSSSRFPLGVKLQYLDLQNPKDIESAFRAANKGHADAVLVLQTPILNSQRRQIADRALKSRLPAIYPASQYVEDGGLMSYGVSISDLDRRAATYVDKILKGAKPAELPVEQPMKFEFIINLKAAKEIGLTIPPNVLARADKVIK